MFPNTNTYNPMVKNFTPKLSLNATPFVPGSSGATDPKSTYVSNQAQQTYTTPSGAVVGANGSTISGQQDTPQQPAPAPAPTAADTAFEEYLKSLTPSPELTGAQKYLNDLSTQGMLANERALDSGDTLGFAAGEAQRVGRNFDIKMAGQAGLVNALTALDAQRSKIGEARYNYEKNKIDEATKAAQFDREQTRLENPAFELSAGQNRYEYNPKTGKRELVASTPAKASTAQAKGTVNSGSLTYSPTAQTEDSQALEATRNDKGYVDGKTYVDLYKAWVANGGLLKGFLSTYDPKLYVDPNDKNVPSYLKAKTSSASDDLISQIEAAFADVE